MIHRNPHPLLPGRGDPCTVGCQHSCAQRGGRREMGDGNADPPRPVRSRRGPGQSGTAGHEPRRHYCPPPPPATVEPRFQARRGDPPSPSRSLSRTHVAATCDAMEEAARWRRRLQRPARSPRLIRDVTERSMNAVAPRAYPHRSPVRVYIKLLSNICNERIHQEKPVSN